MDTAADILNSNLSSQISNLSISASLHLLTELFPGQVCFSTSFSEEDQVILHHIVSENLPVNIFTGYRSYVQRNLLSVVGYTGKI